ncbi:hypothetical protein ACP4OV_018531 [Aristida adscensionis]
MPPAEIHDVRDALHCTSGGAAIQGVGGVNAAQRGGVDGLSSGAGGLGPRVGVGNMALLRELSRLDRGLVAILYTVAPNLAAGPHDALRRADLLEHG